MHQMLVQDIARLLELKFRDFGRAFAAQAASHGLVQTGVRLRSGGEPDLFTRVAERVLALGLEEPNGILGARLKLQLRLASGRILDCSDLFAYDASTMSTSEILVTICEQKESRARKLVHRFSLLARLDKYLPIQLDAVNFSIVKNSLY